MVLVCDGWCDCLKMCYYDIFDFELDCVLYEVGLENEVMIVVV